MGVSWGAPLPVWNTIRKRITMNRKIKVTQMRDGHNASFLTNNRGNSGLTPEEDKWYHSNIETGWRNDMTEDTRRALMLKAHGGDVLAAARALMALHNVTKNMKTRMAAKKDAMYFFKMHRNNVSPDYRKISKNMIPISSRQKPISPRTRPLS
jgi:hypothetical protein